MWGELLSKFVDLVNRDDPLALTSTYVAAAESALYKLSQELVEEYRCEMQQQTAGKFPMEEYSSDPSVETLLSIHHSILHHKLHKFESQVDYLLSVSGEDEGSVQQKKAAALLRFRDAICKLSDDGDGGQQIIDGILHQFALTNNEASRRQCRDTAIQTFRGARDAILATEKNEPEADLNSIALADQAYYAIAIGPAKDEIYLQTRKELEESCKEIADTIPGKPLELRVAGTSKDIIKLRWKGTGCTVGTKYEIQYASDGDQKRTWPGRFENEYAAVNNLETSVDYRFRVRGVGPTGRKGPWSETLKCSTTVGDITRGVATVGTFFGGMFASPMGGALIFPVVGAIGGLVAAPVVGVVCAKKVHKDLGPQGECDSDNEQVNDTELCPL